MKKQTWIEALATVGYVGKFPKGPGTMGTIVALPLSLAIHQLGDIFYAAVTVVGAARSALIVQSYENLFSSHDSKEIVLDEVVGGLVAFMFLTSWPALLLAFVLFRFFDIVKPFPVGWADQKIPGGLGVVADDILAGIITNLIVHILIAKTTWLM